MRTTALLREKPDAMRKPDGLRVDFASRTHIMGILNVTPDSFSDGGRFREREEAVEHGLEMARDGADMIDVGGESTRPGAEDLKTEEELSRVVPVIRDLSKKTKIPISVDTRKATVAEEAIKAGASFINDISGLRHDPAMAHVAAKYGVGLIVMHMKGTPKDMQANAVYDNLIEEVTMALKESIDIAKKASVDEKRIVIDPGIGFGKTVQHNLEILRRLDEFKTLGRPICVGTSRKSFIGKVLGIDSPSERLAGTLATLAIAIIKGASLLRVHDVKEARQAAIITDSILRKDFFQNAIPDVS
jgi:dihydropteroate synthase